MNRRPRKRLDKAPAAAAGVRGEHAYPDRTSSARRDGTEDEEVPEKRHHYAAEEP